MAFNFNDFIKKGSVESKHTLPEGKHKVLVKSIQGYQDRILVNLETLDHKQIRQVASFNMSNERGYELCCEFLSEVGGHQKTMAKNIQEALGKEVIASVTNQNGYLNVAVFANGSSTVLAETKKKRTRKTTTTTVEVTEEPETVTLSDEDLESLGF